MKQESKSVIVTGAGSGLGFATAKLLKAKGWKVFGTIIASQSDEELKELGIIPIIIDISDPKQTDAAAEFVGKEQGNAGLSALINVAGLPVGGLLEGCSPEYMRNAISVIVEGTINMCRSFLPLLRKYGPGRIVNVTTSGYYSPAVFTAPYSICKYAEEGITRVLRFEMIPFGIQATSIEPGGMKTPMTANMAEATEKNWARMGPEIRDIYYDKLHDALEFINKMGGSMSSSPELVARKIEKVLNKKKMKIRYLAGPTVAWMAPAERIFGENRFEKMMAKMQKMG